MEIEEEKDEEEENNDKTNNLINEFNIKSLNPIHRLNDHSNSIKCFTLLKDGRLVSGSEGGKIIIHNKITYKPDLIINVYETVRSLIILKSGVLGACDEYYINFFNIKENKYDKLSIIENDSRGYKLLYFKIII